MLYAEVAQAVGMSAGYISSEVLPRLVTPVMPKRWLGASGRLAILFALRFAYWSRSKPRFPRGSRRYGKPSDIRPALTWPGYCLTPAQ